MKTAFGIVIGILCTLRIAGAQVSDDDARKAFEKVCGVCHETDVATSQRHTRSEWQSITDDMIGRGADATPNEIDALVTWLTRRHGQVRINELSAPRLAAEMELTPAEAETIVTYREKHGAFKDFDALKQVPGVEPSKIERYKDSFIY